MIKGVVKKSIQKAKKLPKNISGQLWWCNKLVKADKWAYRTERVVLSVAEFTLQYGIPESQYSLQCSNLLIFVTQQEMFLFCFLVSYKYQYQNKVIEISTCIQIRTSKITNWIILSTFAQGCSGHWMQGCQPYFLEEIIYVFSNFLGIHD